MTREQAINYLFSCGFTNEQVGEVVRALTYDPTTKNGLGVDDEERELALMYLEQIKEDYIEGVGYERHPLPEYYAIETAIKSLAMPSVTPQLSSELEKNSKKLEKDFGESDCISRQAVLDLIADYDLSMGQVVRGIHALPSVTPQEPFINKPCVSSGVCEHDKNKVLDKLRAEIETKYGQCDICEYFEDYDYEENDISEYRPIGNIADILQIIDKYKAESEE